MPKKKKGEKHVHVQTIARHEPAGGFGKWWLLIPLLTLLAYIPSLQGGFVWDDAKYIQNNPLITTINLKELFSRYVMGNYHPFTMLTYALEYQLFGLDATGYHAVNLLIHLVNVSLVYYFIFLLSGQSIPALLASLFFGIHPLHVESVAWASELKDLLYTFFFLASSVFYLRYLERSAMKFFWLSLAMFLFSLLSKGMAVSLPLVLVLIDHFKGRKWTAKTGLEKLPFFLLALLFGVIAVYAQKSSEAIQEIARFPFLYRIIFASYGYVMYLVKSIFPFQLSAFYPYPITAGETLPAYYYIFPLLAAGIIGLALYSLRLTNKIFFGLAFFTVTVFLVLQLLPVGEAVMADRYSYVPSIGLIYLAGLGFHQLWMDKRRAIAMGLVLIFSVLFFSLTFTRCKVWNNGQSLWTDVIEKYPDVAVAYNNRGGTFMIDKKPQEALADYNRAIELRPDFYDAYNNRGILLSDLQRKEEALRDYNKAIQYRPQLAEAYSNRGLLLMETGRMAEARADFNKAIELQPDYAQAYYNRGLLASNEGRKPEAYRDYAKAIELNPAYTEAYVNRGVLFHTENRLDEALAEYDKAMQLQPSNPQVYFNRGLIMMTRKMNQEAISDFTKAIELKNDYAAAYFNRGMSYVNSGRKDAGCQDIQASARMGFQPALEAAQNYCR